MGIPAFDNSYARLPGQFHARVSPAGSPAPRLLALNAPLAEALGFDPDWLASEDGLSMLAGNAVPDGAQPIAQAYAGHQFGNFVPQLGDGRALLLGEVQDRGGRRRDIQLKGSGPTPFSRNGDGLAAIGPVLREYIVAEAMHALGIATTRALAAVATGGQVIRERMLQGAILTRIASSHVRVGTFQYFYARDDVASLKLLADHVIERHYPEVRDADNPALALFEAVAQAQAGLVASWMHVGFIHGVMNTDNMSIAGETIDYGPCAFMDAHDPKTVYSSIDQFGRYAYGNQPGIAHWNLANFAQTLLPLMGDDEDKAIAAAQEAVNRFPDLYRAAWLAGMRRKLGLAAEEPGDEALAGDLLKHMAAGGADHTNTFRALCFLGAEESEADEAFFNQFTDRNGVMMWLIAWRQRLARETVAEHVRQAAMRLANPAYVPRNHLVEEALAAASEGDLEPFNLLNSVLAHPYEEQPGRERYAQPPRPDEVVHATFCGT